MTVECFQGWETLELILQMLKMVARINPLGSTHLQLAYVMPSVSGDVRFVLPNWVTTSSGVTGDRRTSPSSVAPGTPVTPGCLSGNSQAGGGPSGGDSA